MTVLFRDGRPEDAEAFLDLRREIFPYLVSTAEGIRHRWAHRVKSRRERLFAAEDGGHLVGWAAGGLNNRAAQPGTANLLLMVRPPYRRRGIGLGLLAASQRYVRDLGARLAHGFASDDPDTLGFLRHHGFEQGHRLRFASLALDGGAALPPVPETPPGVAVASFADLGPEPVYRVDSVAVLDEPGDVPNDHVGYGDWLADVWNQPDLHRDASTAVLVDGVPAAVTLIEADLASGRCWSGGTGTLRGYRGRGLAKLAKSVALRRAAEAGVRTAYASNDHVNAPMLAINDWLGYRPVATEWSVLKTL